MPLSDPNIAVLPGDGIGIEVTDAGLEVMLDWLGEQRGDGKLSEAASALEEAVRAAFADGALKPCELGGNAGTREITRAVLEQVSKG